MNTHIFIATTGRGLARAARGPDGNWSVQFVLTDQDVHCLASDPHNPGVVYAGTKGAGVLRSSDRGQTWQPAGLPGKIVKAIAVSRSEPGAVYTGTKSPPLMFVSRNGGAHWTELSGFRRIRSRLFWFSPAEPPFTAYVQGIALSPADPNVIVVGIEFGAVVRTADGGQTWSDHRKGAVRDCHSLTFHATDGNWAYEGGGTGAAFSRDAGQTWAQPKAGLDRSYGWACAADPAQPDIWYVSASPGPSKAHSGNNAQAYIFRSKGGAPWQKLGGGPSTGSELALNEVKGQALPQPLDHMPYALLTDPAAPGHLYAGLSNGDVWHSVDHGDTCQKLPFNLKGIHSTLIML